jgi:hypothetical protein
MIRVALPASPRTAFDSLYPPMTGLVAQPLKIFALLALGCLLSAAHVTTPTARAADSITYPANLRSGGGGGRHLVFLTGDEEYRGEEGLPMLAKLLSVRHGFRCTVLFPLDPDGTINPDNAASLADSEALESADGVVMMLRFRRWPDAVMQRFADAVARGIPMVALRTSTHAFRFPENSPTAFRTFNTFGRDVLGEGWVSHWGPNRQGATLSVVEAANARHPILRGVGPILADSGVYETHPVADATILLRGQVLSGMNASDPPATYTKVRASDGLKQPVNEPMMPVAWIRERPRGGGTPQRIVCTTLGAASDLVDEDLRRLVINSVYWGFGLFIPGRADARVVDPYTPTPDRFGGYRRGVRPADHAIGHVLTGGTPAQPGPAP